MNRNKIYIILAVLINFVIGLGLYGGNLRATFSSAVFYAPQNGTYLETYLSVLGSSVVYKRNADKKFEGIISIKMVFKQKDSVILEKNYGLLSPEIDDTTKGKTNFVDVQRIALPVGEYDFELTISDKNSDDLPFQSNSKLKVDFDSSKVQVSAIEVIESFTKSASTTLFTKSGYDLVPYVSDYFPESVRKLSFYSEVYNASKLFGADEKFVVEYYIRSSDTRSRMSDFSSFTVQKSEEVNVIIATLPIDRLPSGSYDLVLDVKSKNNISFASKSFSFLRNNPGVQLKLDDVTAVNVAETFVTRITNRDTLKDFIKSLRPISSESEKTFSENQLKGADIVLMQQYFLNFWKKRNEQNPEGEWNAYHAEVKKVNKIYGSILFKGYDTDRGRVYLKYGPPDNVTKSESEPDAYPYEMWQYNKMKDLQTNRLFIFYNTQFAGNNYILLHSDARGEPRDPAWQAKLKKSNSDNADPTKVRQDDSYGGRTKLNYMNSK